jgi:hypothetical protein
MMDEDARKRSHLVRERFTHGRSRAVPVVVKKPAKAPQAVGPTLGERLLARSRNEAESAIAAKVNAVNDAASNRFPASAGTTVTLRKGHARACLLTFGVGQSRLVVRGCGPVPSRLRRKSVIVEMLALGLNSRLAGLGITCDGETVLPKRTVQVRFELLDPAAVVEVIVEQRPAGSKKKYGPKRWIKRRTERPVKGRFRRPRPSI